MDVSFSTFMDQALYGLAGFYEGGGMAGKGGDFITSPEVGPLFADVLLAAFDEWTADVPGARWVEVGAGRGTLARQLRARRPGLDVVLVERSAALRAAQAGLGVESRPDLPPGPVEGVIFANELLDNLAFDLLVRSEDGWLEVRVDPGTGTEVLVPATAEDSDAAARLAPAAGPGARIPLQRQAVAFVTDALARLRPGHGRLVLVDYADTTASLAARPWRDWLRTYRAHQRGGPPLEAPGTQDITAEVAVDQLPPPDLDRSQADFLRAHGLDPLVEAARAEWQERAHIGDLAALKARSRVSEAAALTDPDGLGAFRVLEWIA